MLEAQQRGELVDADPAWISAVMRAVVQAALQIVDDPKAAAQAAHDVLVRAFVVRGRDG